MLTSRSSAPRLKAEHLTLGYHSRPVVVDVSLEVPDGAVTTIIGPNGCGKSTLLRGLGRLLPPMAGQVTLDGTPLAHLSTRRIAREVAILPQRHSAPEGLTVADLVSRGRHPRQRWYEQFSRTDEEAVLQALEATGIADLAHTPLDELSGGQAQRAWISLTLAQDTTILLLDEPTTYLDLAHQLEVLELVHRLNVRLGRTVLMVLHDISMAARFSDHIVAMKDGRLVAQGPPTEIVTPGLLQDVFGLSASVVPEPVTGRPHVIPLSEEGSLLRQGLSSAS